MLGAWSGKEAADLAAEHRPALITLDVGLPDLDGLEVCRRLRATTDAYIIMISARADEVDRLLGLEIGADDYLTKPFSPRELGTRVGVLMRRPRSGGELPAEPGSNLGVDRLADAGADSDGVRLRVDPDSRSAALDGAVLDLTRTEFDLLLAFVRHPRRVWSRAALLREVWQSEWSQDTHLVEVHVGNLRRKLGGAEWIRTVRGVGYGLAVERSQVRLAPEPYPIST